MKTSFIVTSFDIAPYIQQCLDGLVDCLDSGDEVIVVDDGSSDETVEIISRFVERGGFAPDINVQLIFLGANTPGGVGIPGNIGLREATGEAVFFVDGDDWLVSHGFRACRRVFEELQPDILIGNYLEYDQRANVSRAPADQLRWDLGIPTGLQERRKLALSLIAVPWRKFYRRAFLEENKLRFPEGKFFYEDNPFHWDVCLRAGSIEFRNSVLCQHRVNRQGQTMSATGAELAAFFTHFETITDNLDQLSYGADSEKRFAAIDWLIGNMAWHLERLRASAFWDYALVATHALRRIDDASWDRLRSGRFKGTAVLRAAEQLRLADTAVVVGIWQNERIHAQTERLNRAVDGIAGDVRAMREAVDALTKSMGAVGQSTSQSASHLQSLVAITEFEAFQALEKLTNAE